MRFLRYPGGKSRLLSFLANLLPESQEIPGKYIEPFVGGGSVFLHLRPERALLSDLNKQLIELYSGIRNYPHKVWETFESFPSGKHAYYKIRDDDYGHRPLYYRAARALYLNRTCFNGMWRHNLVGKFSVGYGGEERRWVINYDNILELSKVFKKAVIRQTDFGPALEQCRDGDFVYLDPPYKPGEKDMVEGHYSCGRFTLDDQVRLAARLAELSRTTTVRWLMTNSSHLAIRGLYEGFYVVRVPRGTSGVVGVLTADSNEVVISNYPLEVPDEGFPGSCSKPEPPA